MARARFHSWGCRGATVAQSLPSHALTVSIPPLSHPLYPILSLRLSRALALTLALCTLPARRLASPSVAERPLSSFPPPFFSLRPTSTTRLLSLPHPVFNPLRDSRTDSISLPVSNRSLSPPAPAASHSCSSSVPFRKAPLTTLT